VSTKHVVIVAGGRDLPEGDRYYIDAVMVALIAAKAEVVITGECRGGDMIGKQAAKELGLQYIGFAAEWDRLGKRAGPARNRLMAEKATHVVLLPGGDGTKNMQEIAQKKYLPITFMPPKK
jgi:predicted Rossmann-fold nucleotide-binding protein